MHRKQEWGFIPSPQVPVFVYFKETQTKGDSPQFHLFPCINDPKALYEQFQKNIPLPGK